ncbi:MAG: hypothetical protein U0800_16630 [Isosphaeraceae bacterium]
MRFVPWCIALAIALAAAPSALAQKKSASKPKPPAQAQKPPKPAMKPAPAPKPAPKPAPHPVAHPAPKPAAQPNPVAAQQRQAEAARAAAMIRAGQLPRSNRPSAARKPTVVASGRSATPSRLIPSSGNLVTQTRNGLASAPRIMATPVPALTGLARAPRITPSAVKTNSLLVQNASKEIVVARGPVGGRYAGRGYAYGRHGGRYGYHPYRSYARFRRPYRNPNAASQALALQRLEQLRIDLDRIRQSRAVPSDSLRAQLGDDLVAISLRKPSGPETAAIRQLADDLGQAVRGHPGTVPPTSDLVLALNQVLNHRRVSSDAVDASIRNGRMVLQAWRVPLSRVSQVVRDLRAIGGTAELVSASKAP